MWKELEPCYLETNLLVDIQEILRRAISASPLRKWLSGYHNFGVNLKEKEVDSSMK